MLIAALLEVATLHCRCIGAQCFVCLALPPRAETPYPHGRVHVPSGQWWGEFFCMLVVFFCSCGGFYASLAPKKWCSGKAYVTHAF